MLFVIVVPEALGWATQLCSIRPPTHLRCAHVTSAQSVLASEGISPLNCCAGQGHRRGILAHPRAGSQARGGQGQPLDRALWHGGRPHALRLGAARLRPRQGCAPLDNLVGMAFCSLKITFCVLRSALFGWKRRTHRPTDWLGLLTCASSSHLTASSRVRRPLLTDPPDYFSALKRGNSRFLIMTALLHHCRNCAAV